MNVLFPTLLSLASVFLAAFAIRFAFKKAKTDQKAQELLQGTTQKAISDLDNIEKKLSTRSIGAFPGHISTIATMIDSAQAEILIACEAGYGCTTAFERYLEYEGAIRRKGTEGVKVRILCPSRDFVDTSRRIQFRTWGEKADSAGFLARVEHEQEFAGLLEKVAKRLDWKVPITSYERFCEALEIENENALANLGVVAEIVRVDSILPLNFWITDEAQAIFAIRSFEGRPYTHAFETRDSQLIWALRSAWEFYHLRSKAKVA